MKSLFYLMAIVLAGSTTTASAVVLVETGNPGFYNNSIGTLLNLTENKNSATPDADDANAYFPVFNDSSVLFPDAPTLGAASTQLGNWLTDPSNLNSFWSSSPESIPATWAVGTEVAIIYEFNTLGATNVQANFDVDNGIFAWLDGEYILGARGPGGPGPGLPDEYTLTLGDLSAGTYFLQLLLEDHGGTNGYGVRITADEFIPCDPAVDICGPDPDSDPDPSVPTPMTLALLGVGLAGMGMRRKKRVK